VWTQRDQIQAYQFLRRRLVSALVTADANHPSSPSRRLVLGTVVGVAAAVLTAAVFGVIGLLDPTGAADWQQGGQVIVEKETGARYVLGQDGLLHPVLNYASARLLAGGNANTTVTVSASQLSSASRGAMLGIPGAPDSLPASASLADTGFATCTRTPPDLPAATEPTSTVVVGASGDAGAPLAPGHGLLVSLPSGGLYLVTAGHRFRLVDQAAAAALGYEGDPTVPVSDNWLDTVPAGRDLGLIAVPDSGADGPSVGGRSTRVGQVLGDGEFYLVHADGLAPISRTEADLVLDDAANAAAYPDEQPTVVRVPVSAVDGAPRSASAGVGANDASTDGAAGYPRTPPVVTATDPNVVLCAFGDGQDNAEITVRRALPLPPGGKVMPVGARTDDRVANEVYVPPGSGALVREQVGDGDGIGTMYLVTDAGQKYPVPTTDALAALGYAGTSPHQVSGTLLALLPTGPTLDPTAARESVVSTGGAR
jgi:type VII secretion protein EccB